MALRYPHATRGSVYEQKRYDMRTLFFLISYCCVAVLCAHALAKADPEPLGASVVLYALVVVSAILFPIAYGLTAEWSNRIPTKIGEFVTGAVCALGFFGSLALIHPSNNFVLSLAIASVVGLGIAISASTLAPNRKDQFSDRDVSLR